jgi:RHS repeat-associated protein
VTSFAYDQAENLISVTRPKEGETQAINDTYTYDGTGLRTSQTISGATSYLTWDVAEGLPLILSDTTNSYIYGPGGLPIEQITPTAPTDLQVLYLHHDEQGSTRVLTEAKGKVVGSTTYNAYGDTIASTGTATTPLGYDAQYTSPDTGLIYMRARTYDPATAQFLSIDPFVALTGEPYSYAADNPLTWADPSGRCGVFCVVGVVAGGVALASGVGEIALGGGVIAEGVLAGISAASGTVATASDLRECVAGSSISCVGAATGGVSGVAGGLGFALGGAAAGGASAIGLTTGGIASLGDAAGAAAASESESESESNCG